LARSQKLFREIRMQGNVRHPNIVPLRGYCEKPATLVYPFYSKGGLDRLLGLHLAQVAASRGALSEPDWSAKLCGGRLLEESPAELKAVGGAVLKARDRLCLALDLSSAVQHLHLDANIVHRDIKVR